LPALPDEDAGRIVCLTARIQMHKGNLTRYWQEGISKEKTRERLRESLSSLNLDQQQGGLQEGAAVEHE
jgi:hypothetical protein